MGDTGDEAASPSVGDPEAPSQSGHDHCLGNPGEIIRTVMSEGPRDRCYQASAVNSLAWSGPQDCHLCAKMSHSAPGHPF